MYINKNLVGNSFCFKQNTRVYPKPLCILFSDTKGIQWVDTDATHPTPVNTEEALANVPFGAPSDTHV